MEDQKSKDEDLLIELALTGPNQDDDTPEDIEVKKFIRNFNIKEGKAGIPIYLLYDFYFWRADYPLSKHKFNRSFKQWFKPLLCNNYTYYKLEPTALGLPEYYTLYGELKRKKRSRKNGKKNKGQRPKSTKK